jgi:N-carbamoyl-L-amino-acid hydrolase
MSTGLQIDAARVQAEIDELAAITSVPNPATTRVLFSDEDLRARAWIIARCEALGLKVRVDAIGNIFARWEGTEPHLPAIATGSHIDAIPNAGRYDGVVGVLGPLEAFRALKAEGFTPRRSLELVVFTSEEPTRFGLGCLGSRLMSGRLATEKALALKDADKVTLAEWLARMPWLKAPLESVRLPEGHYRAFVELHIEQGPRLEMQKDDIGVVEKIAAPSAFRLTIHGAGGHAGAVLMPYRRDALMGASEIALAIEKAALESGSPDTVATVGVLRVEPGAINSIPYRVLMEVDLRDTDLAARERVLERIQLAAHEITARRQLTMTFEPINADPPAIAAPELVESALHHAQSSGLRACKMISRAYHDSLFMAVICPTTMIFIPCRDGVSHRPDEYSSPEQIAAGIRVLAESMRDWSFNLEGQPPA